MKKILLLFAALLSISVSAQNREQKRVDKQTTQWRYELQAAVGQAAEGACLVRVWTYSSKPTIAEGQAGKNAVHGILFKGYPASSDGTRISGREPMISNPAIEEEYSEYFAEFFKSGGAYQRYVSYIGNGIPDAQMELAKDCVYSTDSTAQVHFTFSCLSANEVVGCDLLVPGDDPAIVKEGMLNDLYACWIETYDTDRGADITHHFLLLYDADKLCVVFLGGDWDVTEKIAEHMTIVQTGIPTPEASQNFTYVGVFG